ncbi:(4Fe-4S)-binding protein [Streptomyces sp. NPDC020875]|uniref:ferredoxin n=1 Tax=Streptomyces sp. NPDC020875 TaxID=3154898 RepID=UPI0033C78543
MKITADREVCVGAGMCVLTAPDVFAQDDAEGLVRLLVADPGGPAAEAAVRAVRSCPSGAIREE